MQHPKNWDLPSWVKHGFQKEEMAVACEGVQSHPFLLRGRTPAVGQRLCLYMQVEYEHDGSHPESYRGRARMVGEVVQVLPPPPAGLYCLYSGQAQELSDAELAALRETEPELPPSFIVGCKCGREHTHKQVMSDEGAVHGQRVRATLRLSCDDEWQLAPQLGGEFDIELIYDDDKDNSWVLCKMVRKQSGAEEFQGPIDACVNED